jgi:hypothetical protein
VQSTVGPRAREIAIDAAVAALVVDDRRRLEQRGGQDDVQQGTDHRQPSADSRKNVLSMVEWSIAPRHNETRLSGCETYANRFHLATEAAPRPALSFTLCGQSDRLPVP